VFSGGTRDGSAETRLRRAVFAGGWAAVWLADRAAPQVRRAAVWLGLAEPPVTPIWTAGYGPRPLPPVNRPPMWWWGAEESPTVGLDALLGESAASESSWGARDATAVPMDDATVPMPLGQHRASGARERR
jgi:hypothetical protein